VDHAPIVRGVVHFIGCVIYAKWHRLYRDSHGVDNTWNATEKLPIKSKKTFQFKIMGSESQQCSKAADITDLKLITYSK
jgi:hypothetical protein